MKPPQSVESILDPLAVITKRRMINDFVIHDRRDSKFYEISNHFEFHGVDDFQYETYLDYIWTRFFFSMFPTNSAGQFLLQGN